MEAEWMELILLNAARRSKTLMGEAYIARKEDALQRVAFR
jgi:hypothetical protein